MGTGPYGETSAQNCETAPPPPPPPPPPTHTAGFDYPSNYGVGSCTTHDEKMQPDCADAVGKPKAGAPAWCRDSWCFVNASNCNIANTPSS